MTNPDTKVIAVRPIIPPPLALGAMTTTIDRLATGTAVVIETVIVTGTETAIGGIAPFPHPTLPKKSSTVLVSATWSVCVGCRLVSGTHISTPWDSPHLCPPGILSCIPEITTSRQDLSVPPFPCMIGWARLLLAPLCRHHQDPLSCPGTPCMTGHRPMPAL